MRPETEIPHGLSALAVIRLVMRHPWQYLLRRWNYKSAVMSSLIRAQLFFVVNLAAGPEAAVAAMLTEFVFRFTMAGVYGALTQAFRHVQPERIATLVAMILLPTVGHSLEFVVHLMRGTPHLAVSIAASVALTAVSTAFNLYAMRRGAFITGEGSGTLWSDLIRVPALMAAFLLSWRSRPFI